MIRVMVCTALVAMLLTSMSYAFEVDEFKSGMHVTDALSVAKKKDPDSHVNELDVDGLKRRLYELMPEGEDDDNYNYSTISINERADGENAIDWNLAFCNDKLVRLSRSYRLDWRALANIVHNMNKIYGKGHVVEDVFKLEGDRSVGVPGSINNVGIQIEWRNNLEGVFVSIAHVTYKEHAGSDTDRREKEYRKLTEHYMLRGEGGCSGSK